MADMSLCYIAVVLTAIALMVWGFMDALKKRQASEKSDSEVISRQIRGFAMLVLAQVLLIVGMSLCFGASGGVEKVLKDVGKLF